MTIIMVTSNQGVNSRRVHPRSCAPLFFTERKPQLRERVFRGFSRYATKLPIFARSYGDAPTVGRAAFNAARIYDVPCWFPNRLARDAGDLSRPYRVGEVADEKDRDPMIGPPSRQDGLGEITTGGHIGSPVRIRADG
jgi:hypothetical protein